MKRAVLAALIVFASPCLASSVTGDAAVFDELYAAARVSDGVRMITYDQFERLRSSGDAFIVVDVLSAGDYKSGHIPGAVSLPIRTFTEDLARKALPAASRVVVYCNSFECHASSQAARKLEGWGYKVLDFEGGLQEWQARGGKLVK